MTKSEAIYHRALRCRPAKRNAYVTTHEALLAEAEYLQQTERKKREWRIAAVYSALAIGTFLSLDWLWQIIKGWFA